MKVLETLIKEHTKVLNKQDDTVQRFHNLSVKLKYIKDEQEVKKIKKELKKLESEYSELREDIYSIGDKIAEIDPDILDDIVEPNPDDIRDCIELISLKGKKEETVKRKVSNKKLTNELKEISQEINKLFN